MVKSKDTKSKYIEISNKEYRLREGISSTELKRIAISPQHYKWFKDNPVDSDTPSLLFGRAAHKFILENEDFTSEFAVAPKVNRRTKEGKAEWDAFCTANEGKDIISSEDYEKLVEMKKTMDSTPYVKQLLKGMHEKSFFWKDKESGITCKCRPDSFNEEIGIVVDYKTTKNANARKFINESIDLNYDLQAAFYLDGIKANLGKEFKFVFIAQEKKPPYSVNIFECDPDYIASGREMYKAMLDTYKYCTTNDDWYGYLGREPEITNMELPGWLKNMISTDMDAEDEETEFI